VRIFYIEAEPNTRSEERPVVYARGCRDSMRISFGLNHFRRGGGGRESIRNITQPTNKCSEVAASVFHLPLPSGLRNDAIPAIDHRTWHRNVGHKEVTRSLRELPMLSKADAQV
jgi:hypothetical protein